MKYKYILFFIILLTACQQKREVDPSFYYWKTVYKQNNAENSYLNAFKSDKLYLRIMDVDLDEFQKTAPIAPVTFKNKVPNQVQIVPVVFIVNNALKNQTNAQLDRLAHNILWFVKEKVLQAGKKDYNELQIDCDWTATTRNSYFYLLRVIKKFNADRLLSATLRLHQLKNQLKSGIPPVDKVLLMCYNMGNLRQFGTQNSILELNELKKYADKNLSNYPMPIDIALPLFSWAVVFDNANYAGISKKLSLADLKNPAMFKQLPNGLFVAQKELPAFGIKPKNTVRFEDSKFAEIKAMAKYLTRHLSKNQVNLVYYHLDQKTLKSHPINELEEINRILR